MFAHFSASCLPAAVVTCRQLLPPKPSSKASVAFFGPHQDGASAASVKEGKQPRVAMAVIAARVRLLFEKIFTFSSHVKRWRVFLCFSSIGQSKRRYQTREPGLG